MERRERVAATVTVAVCVLGTATLLADEVRALGSRLIGSTVATHEEPLSGLSDFERGRYYFNHTDDPQGPYDLEKARYYFTQALESDPTGNTQVWYQLGRIDFLEGKFTTAIHKFDRQLELFGAIEPRVYYMLGLTHGYQARTTDDPLAWQKAEASFLDYIEYDPFAPWPRVDLAWTYFAQGKFDRMRTPLEEGLRFHPDNAWLLNMYGLALLNTGEPVAARAEFEKATDAAAKLTPADWGRTYPGNDPANWAQGLQEFQAAIHRNLELVDHY